METRHENALAADHGDEREPFISESEKTPDLESQPTIPDPKPAPTVSRSTTTVFLIMYFVINVGLTFYNKLVLGSFHFPWILTAIHTLSASFGSSILLGVGHFKLTKLSAHEHLALFLFSLLFTINIAMSNVSLAMVSVPFHQIMRATTPVFAIAILRLIYAKQYSTDTYASLIPVIAGVGLASYGDYYFTTMGFTLTLLGVVLAAIKTVVTNRIMTGRLRLGALELLLRMGPYAATQSVLYSVLTGEFSQFLSYVKGGNLGLTQILAVGGNGALAFALNVASFQSNKLAGALSMTICGNMKQCITIIFGALLWDVQINTTNAAGIALTLGGAAWYSAIQLREKR